jgi:two-component system chemotaxis response regulator CheY
MRILLVDTSFTSRRVTEKILQRFGECVCVPAGEVAITMIEEEQAAGRAFDVVCVDLFMPRMDGIATVRAIREWIHHHAQQLKLQYILISAVDDQATIRKCYAENIDGFLHKPLDFKAVESLLKRLGWKAVHA